MASGSYTAPTLGEAVDAVAARLIDASHVRWTMAELVVYLQQTLRTWNALTSAFRDTGVFTSVANQAFYDLPTVLPTLRGQTVTGSSLVNLLEYHLLEPPSGTAQWTGSLQFTLADLAESIQKYRDQFLLDTGAVITHHTIPVSPPPDGRVPIPESILDIRRAAWMSATGVVTPLDKTDEWSANAYTPSWPQRPTAPPRGYSLGVTQPLYVQLVPVPSDAGVLDLLTVDTGPVIDPTSTGLLGVPDDWSWVVAFGALSDLLSHDGLSIDPPRAAYCQSRWAHGVAAAAAAAVVLTARITNRTQRLTSITDLDHYARAWQTLRGIPRQPALMGHTLLALAPVPVTSTYAITLDIVRNAPIPVALHTPLQISPAYLDVIYDYAQHLAIFKDGPGQLQLAMPLLESFFRAAGVWTQFDQAHVPNRAAMLGQQTQESAVNPRVLVPVDAPSLGTVVQQ